MNSQFHTSNPKYQIQLKVCGLTQLGQIEELISLNVDFLGFIFYEKSPRYVLNHLSLKDISEISHQRKVGVFVNESLENILKIAELAGLNFIQLHGDENVQFVQELKEKLNDNIKIIKVIRIGNQSAEELQKIINQQPSTIDYFLFDTDSKAFGGTGKTFDWNILNQIGIPLPYFLSGGISLENLSNLSNLKNQPFAIDVNSKFEIEPGVKNLEKIKILKTSLTK